MQFLVYRTIAVAYCVLFILYFVFRAVFSIGSTVVSWRVFVLLVEFLSSVNVLFVVIMKIRLPWTEFVSQDDGTMMKAESLLDEENNDPDKDDKDAVATKALQDDLDEELTSTPQSHLIGPAAGLDLDLDRKENISEYGASERLEEEDEDDDDQATSGGKVSMAATRVGQPKDPDQYLPFVIRVLVPCYKEGLDIIQPTIIAALKMKHDTDKLHVYLCDDGRDPAKESWIAQMNNHYPNLHYITRPEEHRGHGKAGNLNYCLKHVIYKGILDYNQNITAPDAPEELRKKRKKYINRKEVVAIFDADMVARSYFLARLLPYFSRNRRVVMVQSPQTFHNVPMNADFFDAHNINFFQYMLPSFGAWNTTTCCGTNFLVAARALQAVNFFPTISVTEDMYLAMLLLAAGGKIEYHSENLVVGEAPQDLRQIFQQRSRWAKGTIEIFYKDNPLLKRGLPIMARLSFFNACWSYFTSAFFNPLFVFINAAGILFGLFPVTDLTFGISLLFVCYYGLFYAIILATPAPHKHFIGLWVVGKMGHFFSFMSLKAIWNITLSVLNLRRKATFKATKKNAIIGQQQKLAKVDRDSSHKDIVFHWIMSLIILATIFYGIYQISGGTSYLNIGGDERNEYQRKGIQVFMTFWMFQFLISYSLPLWYAYLPQDFSIQAATLKYLALLDSFLSLALVILTALLFKVPFLLPLPNIGSINDFAPADSPFWVTDLSKLSTVGGYIYDTALSKQIPAIAVFMRAERDTNLMSQGGLADWVSYRAALSSLATTLQDKDFPCVVIFEPNWMYESMYLTSNQTDAHYYAVLDSSLKTNWPYAGASSASATGSSYLAWNQEKWFRTINSFLEFAYLLGSKYYVYIDAADPYYHESLLGVPFAVLNYSLSVSDVTFRGIALNVGNYYADSDILTTGTSAYDTYGWNWVSDTSRNGGTFSQQTKAQIDSCRYDPPNMDAGAAAEWILDGTSGMDANLWLKELGHSDGRLYAWDEYHSCLINHNIGCTTLCPEVPYRDPITGQFTRKASCLCDSN